MKDTYRERIKEEQKKLSPQQVFFSEGYQRLFQHLADEVAGEKLEQLLLYQSTEDGLAGWNDGKRIGINIGNLIKHLVRVFIHQLTKDCVATV